MYTQVYKFLSSEGGVLLAEGKCQKVLSFQARQELVSHAGVDRGGQRIENVPPVRFKIESNCEGRRKVTCAGYLTAASMVLH